MTVITDVPESGIYFQQGAITQIIAQILDANTGEPIQLQTATGLSISVLYPDLISSQTFAAHLLTDGSDGKIYYTTVNDEDQMDLSQVGLYQFQGSAAIDGVISVLSYLNDFYVLKNAFTNISPPPPFNSSALILFDSTGVRWSMTVSPDGELPVVLQPSGPANYLQFNSLVMKDSDGLYWTVSVSTIGVISGTPGGAFQNAIESFFLTDINGTSWVVTIDTDGTLVAA